MDNKVKVRLMLKDKTTVATKGYKERNAGTKMKDRRQEGSIYKEWEAETTGETNK